MIYRWLSLVAFSLAGVYVVTSIFLAGAGVALPVGLTAIVVILGVALGVIFIRKYQDAKSRANEQNSDS